MALIFETLPSREKNSLRRSFELVVILLSLWWWLLVCGDVGLRYIATEWFAFNALIVGEPPRMLTGDGERNDDAIA